MRAMRILILCEGDAETQNSWSGISKSVVDHLRALGHIVYTGDVDLSGMTRWLTIAASYSPDRFRWWARYHLNGFPFELRSRRAERIIRSHGDEIDVILQFGATFEPRGRAGIPYVIYCDGNARLAERGETGGQAEVGALTQSELARVIRRETEVYTGASKIFTFSNRLTDSFVEDFGIAREKVRTVHAGPNIDPHEVVLREGEPAREPRTILFVGRKFHRKGGDLLLRALPAIRKDFPGTRLLVIGPTAPPAPQEGVEFLGFLSKENPQEKARLSQSYREADIFCLPTRFEPFGVVFLEAMLHALPCIGPNAWAVPEIVVHDETGLIVEPENVDDLAAAIKSLLEDPALARRMGFAGRQRTIDHFLWDKVVTNMLEDIRQLV